MVKERGKGTRDAEASSGKAQITKWLLDAIRKVKHQKQRPCVERISHALRHATLTQDEVESELEAAVRNGHVMRVLNKGIWSYRDPAGNSSLPTRTLKVNRKSDLTKIIIKCIRDIGDKEGSTLKCIEKYICRHYSLNLLDNVNLTHQLRISAKRATVQERLIHEGRCYRIGVCDDQEIPANPPVDMAAEKTKNKKVANPVPICSFCLGTTEKNRDGVMEEMISCADCGNSGHPSCLQFSAELTERVKNVRWQCMECKICSNCAQSGKEDNMLFCDSCDRGFHMQCCKPPMTKPPKGNWECCICEFNKKCRRKSLGSQLAKKKGALFDGAKHRHSASKKKKVPTATLR